MGECFFSLVSDGFNSASDDLQYINVSIVPLQLNYIEKLIQKMSVLKQKLDKAAQKFQTHSFKEALQAYEDCLSFCYRTDESKQIIFNIMSTKGALLCILGEYDKAMSTLNQIIKNQPNHFLALMRRSQVYKKRGKFNRAYKDIQTISNFCPDNLQLVAMKIQIENLKAKNKDNNSSQESESQDIIDEDLELNFSGLKKIDRKSCSIMIPQMRKSRVTISGDTAFEYERNEEVNCDKSNSTAFSKDVVKEKYQKTFTQIEGDEQNEEIIKNVVNIVVKSNARAKSILKNRGSILPQMKNKTEPTEKYGGKACKLLQKIKDIDGKMISSMNSIVSHQKQVQFRKSIHFDMKNNGQNNISTIIEKKKAKSTARKSCMKRSSYEHLQKQIKRISEKPAARRSKFQMLEGKNIDGSFIKNNGSAQVLKKEHGKNSEDSDGDQSEHNIFGSGKLMLSKQISERFGLQKQSAKKSAEKTPKGRSNGGKSILKKSSVLSNSIETKPPIQSTTAQTGKQQIVRKAKKSVMFTKSRFAQ